MIDYGNCPKCDHPFIDSKFHSKYSNTDLALKQYICLEKGLPFWHGFIDVKPKKKK